MIHNNHYIRRPIIIFFKDLSYIILKNAKITSYPLFKQMYPHYGYNNEFDLIFDYPSPKKYNLIAPLINVENQISYIVQMQHYIKLPCLHNSKMSNSSSQIILRIDSGPCKVLNEDSLLLIRMILSNDES